MNLWTPRLPIRTPQMPAGILVEARELAAGGNGAIVGGIFLGSPENSGKVLSGFHSAAPSAWISVCPLARCSASQRRISSALTGPYCLPSDPMILYIAVQ